MRRTRGVPFPVSLPIDGLSTDLYIPAVEKARTFRERSRVSFLYTTVVISE